MHVLDGGMYLLCMSVAYILNPEELICLECFVAMQN